MKTGNLWDDFEWTRATDGYRWLTVKDGIVLVPAQDYGKPLRTTSYRPLSREYSGLLNEIASLQPTPDSVLAFANRYGLLGWPVTAQVFRGEAVSRPAAPSLVNAAPFATDDDPPHRQFPGIIGEYLAHPKQIWDHRSTWSSQIRKFSEFKRNHLMLKKVPLLAPSLQMLVNFELAETAGPYVSWSRPHKAFRLRLWPKSLAGALWLQAAIALSLPLEIRQCVVCETPIELSRAGGARTDAMFCSPACKSKDYRQRKANARRLRSDGKTILQIARQLRANPTTVKDWIRKTE
jgi:hypothetical protein